MIENLVKKGQGRPKGSKNKVSAAAKEVIAAAAAELGGHTRIVEWAKEDPANERVFWGSMYTKLIAVTLAGDADNPLRSVNEIVIRAVDAASDRPASKG